jgi:DNA (cytosine-5)-methyltransferase 1
MDAADLKLGQRVYNKNGKLMAIDLNRQVDILNRQDAANWPTPKANDPEKRGDFNPLDHRTGLPGAVKLQLHGQAAPANPSTDGSRQGLWQTPDVGSTAGGRSARGQSAPHKASLEKQCQWATPRSGKTTDENPETWAARQAKGDVATMPLTAQVKCWPTICAGDYRTPPTNSGIAGQTIMPSSEHALPKAAGGKLNPRWVETLMGLPVGWVMPSCASPVTIEPTNYDSWATESCLPQPSELFAF